MRKHLFIYEVYFITVICEVTLASACIFLFAFLQKSSTCAFNLNLLSIFISSILSHVLLLVVSLPIFNSLWLVELIWKWHLSRLAFIWLSGNHLNKLFAFNSNFFGAFISSVRCIIICITRRVNVINDEEQVTKKYIT